MTPLIYRRLSSMPPPEREILEVDENGSFALWRSVAPTAGRFGGSLPAVASADLARTLTGIGTGGPAAPDPGRLPADAGVEQLEVGARRAAVAAGEDPGGPWGELLTTCRRLADELTQWPLAAVALEVEVASCRVRLVHRGDATLSLRLAAARIQVEAWQGTHCLAAHGVSGLGLDRVEAGPGWSLEAAVPPLGVEPGDRVTAEATFVVEDAGIYVPVALLTTIAVA